MNLTKLKPFICQTQCTHSTAMNTLKGATHVFKASRDSFPQAKRPTSAKVRNKLSYTSTPPIRLHSVDKENLTCTLELVPMHNL
jgi:hypothetical protein